MATNDKDKNQAEYLISGEGISKRNQELFTVITAYASCVSLVVEHFEGLPPKARSRKNLLRNLLSRAVDQWCLEHPEIASSARQKLRKLHEDVILSVDQS